MFGTKWEDERKKDAKGGSQNFQPRVSQDNFDIRTVTLTGLDFLIHIEFLDTVDFH